MRKVFPTLSAILLFLLRIFLAVVYGFLTEYRIVRMCVRFMLNSAYYCWFLQYWYKKCVSQVIRYLVIVFAHSFGNDIWLIDQMSCSAHVCDFYVVFAHRWWSFEAICAIEVFCILGVIVLFFLRIILGLVFGCCAEFRTVRICRCRYCFLFF